MQNLKERIKNLKIARREIIAACVGLLFALAMFFDTSAFHGKLLAGLLITDFVLFGLFLFVIAFMASFSIMRALVEVAAGLSLLIFLAQSYCGVVGPDKTADDALKSLLGVGLIYLAYYFLKKLYEAGKATLARLDDKKKSWERTVFIGLYVMFMLIFVWDIYRVMQPIVAKLCVYTR